MAKRKDYDRLSDKIAMNEVWVVAKQEAQWYMGSKSYKVMTILLALAMIVVAWLLPQPRKSAAVTQQITIATTQSNVQALSTVAHSEKLLIDAQLRIVIRKDLAAIKQSVLNGQATMGYDHSTMVFDSPALNNKLIETTRILEIEIHNTTPPVTLKHMFLTKIVPTAKKPISSATTNWILWISILLMTALTWWLMRATLNVVQEKKRERIIEILLSAINAKTLVLGKVVGLGLALLAQAALITLPPLAFIGVLKPQVFQGVNATDGIVTLLCGIIGYAAYATFGILLGAMTPSVEESQIYALLGLLPITIGEVIMSLMMEANSVGNTGIVEILKVFMLVPWLAPLIVPTYWMLGQIVPWQLILVVVANVGIIYFFYQRWTAKYEATVLDTTSPGIWKSVLKQKRARRQRQKAQAIA